MEVGPGYKLTETGAIPEDWDAVRLIDVADCLDSARVPLNETERQRIRGDVPYCGANGVLDYVNAYVLDDDIILMAEDGGYFDEYASRPIAYRMKGKCWVNNHAHILKARSGHDQGFLFYSLVHKNILPFLASSTRAKLNKSEMERIVVPAPPSEAEQRAIAAALGDADALLDGLDRLITKKHDLKQAAMQQLLTGQTRIPGFHGEWEVKKFSDVLSRLNAKAHQIQASDYESAGTHPVVDQGKQAVVGFSDRDERCLRCPSGGVIVFGDHTCIVKFIDFDFLVGADGTQLLQGRPEQSTRFLAYQLQYRGVEPTGYNRHFKFLKERAFMIPSLPEQVAIAAVLSDMDTELAALEARRDKTRALKQAMMQELLTGRTRLV